MEWWEWLYGVVGVVICVVGVVICVMGVVICVIVSLSIQ